MKTIGELVGEAIDFISSGLPQYAIVSAALAIRETAREDDADKFIKENLSLIAFLGLPRSLPLPLNIAFGLKRVAPQFNVNGGADEMLALLIRETLKTNRLPSFFAFHSGAAFEIREDKLYLPESLLFGLLGAVILHPNNANEQIGDKYWMNISDFKMFISELWGRRDLAERIMRFYLE